MKYSAEALSLAGDKYLGRSYKEMDCQAFVERCMSDVGYGRNLAGSNAWFRAMDWTGSPEDCIRVFGSVPTGALLFILEQDGKEPEKYRGDGIGNASHIGIVTHRDDGAIHSSSSRGCVATSVFKDKTIKNGGWNRVGLLGVFDYGKAANWLLEHGNDDSGGTSGGEAVPLHGVVYAEDGGTVKLRQKPSTNCNFYYDIKVGTELTICERGTDWSKCSTPSGLSGWMKNEFIRFDDDSEGDDGFSYGDDDPVADDPGAPDPDAAAQLLAEIYDDLRGICEKIEKAIGRG